MIRSKTLRDCTLAGLNGKHHFVDKDGYINATEEEERYLLSIPDYVKVEGPNATTKPAGDSAPEPKPEPEPELPQADPEPVPEPEPVVKPAGGPVWKKVGEPKDDPLKVQVGVMEATVDPGKDGQLGTDDDKTTVKPKPKTPAKKPGPKPKTAK